MTEGEPRPIDRAWVLVDEALYQAEGGGGRVSLDLSLPTDPAEVGHLVFSLVRIATEALRAHGIVAEGELDLERARVVTESIRQVTSAEPDPVRGVSLEDARASDHYGPNGPVEAVYAFLRSEHDLGQFAQCTVEFAGSGIADEDAIPVVPEAKVLPGAAEASLFAFAVEAGFTPDIQAGDVVSLSFGATVAAPPGWLISNATSVPVTTAGAEPTTPTPRRVTSTFAVWPTIAYWS